MKIFIPIRFGLALCLLCFLVVFHSAHAQTFRNVYFDEIKPAAIVQNHLSGYLIIGWRTVNFQQKVTFHQLDSLGNTQWIKYGDISIDQTGWAVPFVYLHNNGYKIIFSTAVGGNERETDFIRMDYSGNILSTNRYKHNFYRPRGCGETHNGENYLFATTNPDDSLCIVKTNSLGQIIWAKAILNETNNYKFALKDLRSSIDGGFFIYGTLVPPGTFGHFGSLFIIKADSSGSVQWTKAYYGSEFSNVVWSDYLQISDGGIVVTGQTTIGLDTTYQKIVKFDSVGNFLWGYKLSPLAEDNMFYNIHEDFSGNLFVRGYSIYDNSLLGATITKFNPTGNVIQVNLFEVNPDYAYDFVLTKDSSFAAIAPFIDTSNYNWATCLIKTDQNGLSGCIDSVMYATTDLISPLDSSFTVDFLPDSIHMTTTPYALSNLISSPGVDLCSSINSIDQFSKSMIQFYPNPASAKSIIKVNGISSSNSFYKIISIKGALVGKGKIESDGFQLDDLSSGCYIVEINDGINLIREKLMIYSR